MNVIFGIVQWCCVQYSIFFLVKCTYVPLIGVNALNVYIYRCVISTKKCFCSVLYLNFLYPCPVGIEGQNQITLQITFISIVANQYIDTQEFLYIWLM